MSIDYRLTLAGDVPLDRVAARAFPEPADAAAFEPYESILVADLWDRRGFGVTVHAGREGYVDGLADDARWEWEPDPYTTLSFDMDKNAPDDRGIDNLMAAVSRVLRSGAEDAALVLNGEVVVLTRFGGELRKHNRQRWWSHYPGAEASIGD
ncbi:SitI3 family protein [Micromonospora sp. NPDC049891]|uniref:SitI3 family protein n=1 Tax=Micromonospora sp. NPDC049891 TaxID=3155655 RepID=UPI0033D0895B